MGDGGILVVVVEASEELTGIIAPRKMLLRFMT